MNQTEATEWPTDALTSGYSAEPIPLASYGGFLGAFGATFLTFMAATNRSRRNLPKRISSSDLLLLGIATHKITRIITKDWVTSPLRAPFTSYQGSVGGGEVEEKARGSGFRKATGELLTCPWCFAPWTASGLIYGLVHAPRTTRLIGSIFTTVAISDFLQHGYDAVRRSSRGK